MSGLDYFNEILDAIADEIDVGDSRYEDAEGRYRAVGQYLDADDSPLHRFKPDIYVQGSFSLGTAIKPYGDDGEYDVDTLCVLRAPPAASGSPESDRKWLREAVGGRLRSSDRYGPMLVPPEGRRRCWTIQYSDASKFHLDVCPAVPADPGFFVAKGIPLEIARHAVLITDNTDWSRWVTGNALGYRMWFRERMAEQINERRTKVAAAKFARVQDVPDYQVRTTLQKAIQLLKRHRDIMYGGDADAPISIIITTLAAQAYDNDPNLARALGAILNGMPQYILDDGGRAVVLNPVNPSENFAEKWSETPRKRDVFTAWLESAAAFFKRLAVPKNPDEAKNLVREAFGTRDGNAAFGRLSARWAGWSAWPVGGYPLTLVDSRALSVAHAKSPEWPVSLGAQTASIHCFVKKWAGFRHGKPIASGEPVPKHVTLRFNVTTTVKEPYAVHWQVTNTGDEAKMANSLRGDFYPSEMKVGKRFRDEPTAYQGTHWVRCFIVKEGALVARSEPFYVKIS